MRSGRDALSERMKDASVAQGIEHCPPEAGAAVRFRSDALKARRDISRRAYFFLRTTSRADMLALLQV